MTIKFLGIQNFQSHDYSKLEFVPGINVVVGKSDTGKSTIIRALNWCINNRPQGESFRSKWGGSTHVSITLPNNIRIMRTRTGGVNNYLLQTSKNPESIFEALRSEVPEEIKLAFNLGETNLAKQFDRPFLLDNSPGEVAQHFNRMINLDTIDSTIANVQKWYRETNIEVESLQKHIGIQKTELERYKDLDDLEAELNLLEVKEKHKNNLTKHYNGIVTVLNDLDDVKVELNSLEKITKLDKKVETVFELQNKKSLLETEAGVLRTLIRNIRDNEHQINNHSQSLINTEKEFSKYKGMECPACGGIIK